MKVDPNVTLRAARAYGPVIGRVGAARPGAPEPAAKAGDGLRTLVAGRAPSGIEFEKASVPATGAFQLYTRAADKVEAAVAVQIGRSLDVRA